ncbi:MAG: hypothetical protein IJU79_06710 [Desulfovibrionaceae bacterium]|nr:hypothetical protein [Desulfovibrionaceae bacterium]
MKQRLKLVGKISLAVLIVFLLLGLGIVWLTQNRDWLKATLIEGVETRLGQKCTLGQAELTFTPWPVLILTDVKSSGADFQFSCKHVVFEASLGKLLLGQVQPSYIELEEPKLTLATLPSRVKENTGGTFTLPSGCALLINQGSFVLSDARAPKISLTGLTCYFHTSFGQHLQGDLHLKNADIVDAEEQYHLSDLLFLGDIVLQDFWRSNSRFNVKVQVKNETWLPNCTLSTTVDKHAGDFEARSKISGHFAKDKQLLPFNFVSTCVLDDDTKILNFKETFFGLGERDKGSFQGSLNLAKKSLEGNLSLERVSLTEWLGFARDLPPGLQISLDTVSDAKINFVLDGKGLNAKHIEATCQGSTFVGTGGVPLWQTPVVTLDLQAKRVDLIKAIPEAAAILPKGLQFKHGYLAPVESATPTTSQNSVGYDIRLGAQYVDYGPLILSNVKVRIHPAKQSSDITLEAKAAFYDGKFTGKMLIGGEKDTTFAIEAQVQDANGAGLGKALPILPMRKGKWSAQAQITSLGTELAVFLKHLKGSAKVFCRQGELLLPQDTEAIVFSDLTASLLPLKSGQWERGMLGLDGTWKLSYEHRGDRINCETVGKIFFGKRGGNAGLEYANLPVQFSWKTAGELLVQGKMRLSQHLSQGKLQAQELILKGAHATYQGHAELLGTTMQGSGEVQVPDLKETLSSVGVNVNVPPNYSKLSCQMQWKMSTKSFDMHDVHLKTGFGSVKGSLSVPLGRSGSIDLRADLDFLDLDARLSELATDSKPLDLSFLNTVQLKGILSIADLNYKKIHLFQLRVPFTLNKSILNIPDFSAILYAGTLAGHAKLHLVKPYTLEFGGKLRHANIDWLARDNVENGSMAGQADVAGVFSAKFTKASDWPQCLQGTWNAKAFQGKYQALNRQGKPKGSPTKFSQAQASGKISDGIITSRDLFMQGSDFKVKGVGELDLKRETIDCRLEIDKRGVPLFPIYIEGKLNKTKTSIGAGQLLLNAIGGIFGKAFSIF